MEWGYFFLYLAVIRTQFVLLLWLEWLTSNLTFLSIIVWGIRQVRACLICEFHLFVSIIPRGSVWPAAMSHPNTSVTVSWGEGISSSSRVWVISLYSVGQGIKVWTPWGSNSIDSALLWRNGHESIESHIRFHKLKMKIVIWSGPSAI